MTIVMSEKDADTLIRQLYKGERPKHAHTLVCGCGEVADLRQDPAAWDGWRVLPTAKCPACLDLLAAQLVQWTLQPMQARARFLALVEAIGLRPQIQIKEGR
jgi:2-keto-3-deoxy-galactonokinase